MATPRTAQPTMPPSTISVSRSQTGTAGHLEHAEPDEGPDHEDVAVGEVQELEDTVDEGVAKRDQRVRAALGQAIERELREGVQRRKASLTTEGGPGIGPGPPSDPTGGGLPPSSSACTSRH